MLLQVLGFIVMSGNVQEFYKAYKKVFVVLFLGIDNYPYICNRVRLCIRQTDPTKMFLTQNNIQRKTKQKLKCFFSSTIFTGH